METPWQSRETMSRVRQNIETLIARLVELGFVFGYDHKVLSSLSLLSRRPDAFEYDKTLSWVRKQPPVFRHAHLERFRAALNEQTPFLPDWEEQVHRLAREMPSWSVPLLEAAEQEIGPFPLSIHACYSEMGVVNFYGYFAPWAELLRSTHLVFRKNDFYLHKQDLVLMPFCDPLQARA